MAVFLWGWGCADPPPAEDASDEREEHSVSVGDGGLVFVAEGEQLWASLSGAIDEGFVTEPIEVGERPFDRVGLRFDAPRTPQVDVRVSSPGDDDWSDWGGATVSYQEGIAHNAHADIEAPGSRVQLRFRGLARDEVEFLVVQAFEYQPEPMLDLTKNVPQIEQLQQSLAANTGVDVGRAGWGASPHGCSVSHGPYRITVHHTVTPTNDSVSVAQRVQQIQNFHMTTQGWCDVGYHFLIGQDGQVYQGRPEGLRGTHVGGNNSGNLGVSFIGTYTNGAPGGAMMEAGGQILAAISGFYGIPLDRSNVRGHREYGGTSCPGTALYGQLDHLLTIAQGSDGGSGGETNEQGCTPTEVDNCGSFGCSCVNGECAGGYCDGSGCTEQQEENCAAFGCGCVDGECAGGFCEGSGCTAKQQNDCGNFGCGCVDGECAGGFCEGSGCTAKQQMDCGNFGCSCVDGSCAGGYCEGSGCTALQQINCSEVGCGCVDGECAGGFCDGTGCTAKQETDCGNVGCDCLEGDCAGGFCAESQCEQGQLDCGDGMCVAGDGCCDDADCSQEEVCEDHSCQMPGELHARMELSPLAPVYPNVPEPNGPGTAVSASDVSIGDVSLRQWNFEDGDPDGGDAEELAVRFQSPGDKSVSLQVCIDGETLCDTTTKTVEVLDPAPTLGELYSDVDSAASCLPIHFQVDGVGGYPIPELTLEVLEASTDDVIAAGDEVSTGLWDTTGVAPGEYYARLTALNQSGEAYVESPTVEVLALGSEDELPEECEDGESLESDDVGALPGDAGRDDVGSQDSSDAGIDSPTQIDAGTEEDQIDDGALAEESCGGCSVGQSGGNVPAVLWVLVTMCLVGDRRKSLTILRRS